MTTGTDTLGRHVQIKIDGVVEAEFDEISIDNPNEIVSRPKFGTPYPNRTPGDIETTGRLRQPGFTNTKFLDLLTSGGSFQIDYERIADSKKFTIPDCYVSSNNLSGSAGNNVQQNEISFSGKNVTASGFS